MKEKAKDRQADMGELEEAEEAPEEERCPGVAPQKVARQLLAAQGHLQDRVARDAESVLKTLPKKGRRGNDLRDQVRSMFHENHDKLSIWPNTFVRLLRDTFRSIVAEEADRSDWRRAEFLETMRLDTRAMAALHTVMEGVMQEIMRQSGELAEHGKRVTVYKEDLQLALRMREQLGDPMAAGVVRRVFGPEPRELDERERERDLAVRARCRQNMDMLSDILHEGKELGRRSRKPAKNLRRQRESKACCVLSALSHSHQTKTQTLAGHCTVRERRAAHERLTAQGRIAPGVVIVWSWNTLWRFGRTLRSPRKTCRTRPPRSSRPHCPVL